VTGAASGTGSRDAGTGEGSGSPAPLGRSDGSAGAGRKMERMSTIERLADNGSFSPQYYWTSILYMDSLIREIPVQVIVDASVTGSIKLNETIRTRARILHKV